MRHQPNEAVLLLLLVALGSLSGISFLHRFVPFGGDAWPHIVRTQIVCSEFFASFRAPIWSFFFYCGYPFLQFYSPLSYYVAGLITALTGGNVFTGVKCVLFLCHIASGIGMYYLAREIFRNRSAAFVAAIAYLLTFWHVYQILFLARYPVAFFYLLFPYALLSLELLVRTQSRRHTILVSVVIALLILTHIGYAFYAVLFMVVWFVLRLGRSPERQVGRGLLHGIGALVGALLLSSALLIPFVLESPYCRTTVAGSYPPVLPRSLIEWWDAGRLPSSGRYLGLSLVGLSLVGVLEGIRSRRWQFRPIVACAILALFLALAKGRIGFLDTVPIFSRFPGMRFLTYLVSFLPLLAAGGYLWVERRLNGRPALLLCSVLLIGDLLPMSIQNVYHSPESIGARYDYYERLGPDSTDSRVLDLGSSLDDPFNYFRFARYPGTGFILAGRPSPIGFYPQFAPASANYAYHWANEVGREIGDTTTSTVSAPALSALHLLDVGHVIVPVTERRGPSATVMARKKGVRWDTLGAGSPVLPAVVCAVDDPSPVLASNVVRPWPAATMTVSATHLVPSDWRALLDSSAVDPQTHTLRVIWSRDGLCDSLPGNSPELAVVRSSLQHQRVELDLSVSKECYLRLPYSYFPTLKLSVDDRDARVFCGADGFLFVKVPAGRHRLVLVPTLSRTRELSIALNLAAILGLVGIVCWQCLPLGKRRPRGVECV